MTKKEKQFEERLNSLILLKALLIKENTFDEGAQQEYQKAWEEMFELLKEQRMKQAKSLEVKNIIENAMIKPLSVIK